MRATALTLFLSFVIALPAFAQTPAEVVPDTTVWVGPGEGVAVETPIPPQLTFIGYSFTRTTASNVTPINDLLQGQVIGRLFGPNTTTTVDRLANYTEQRFVPMFVYRPRILDGFATFRGLFKIDYTWGDQAYGVGNNRGGAINAGQVNLQTLMANVDIRPSENYNVVVGLQRIFDGARDPNITALDTYYNSGYKLAYWGTQGVGVSGFGQVAPGTRARLGFFQLWENQVSRDDDVQLVMLDVEHIAAPGLEVGADVWYVRDRAQGAGGISILGQGLNSLLAEYNGATRLALPRNYLGDIVWVGTRATYNRGFALGQWMADGFVMANTGMIRIPGEDISILGVAANARVGYKYGRTPGDNVTLEALYTTGDEDGAADGHVSSVITGNVWGSPVGIYTTGRAFLLFPDAQVVSRYYSVVHDISNQGLGVTGLFLNASRDIIPHRFNAKVGAATAFSNTSLPGGGNYMGTEVNLQLKYSLRVFLDVGLSAAYLSLGDFFDAPRAVFTPTGEAPPTDRPNNPFVIFTTLTWMMF